MDLICAYITHHTIYKLYHFKYFFLFTCISHIQGISCTLRHSFGRDDPRFAIPAGLLASVSFTKYPDVTVALYVMWKALQVSLIYEIGSVVKVAILSKVI